MTIKLLRQKDPKSLLKTYIVGSLTVLSFCLGTAALVLSWMFTRQEHQRAKLSLAQVNSFMEFQYRPIGEEMWTSSYEAIGLRIKDIARLLGGADYDFVLVNPSGICLYTEASGQTGTKSCEPSAELIDAIPKLSTSKSNNPILFVDKSTGKYHYLAPVRIGTVLKGYILAVFSDPYHFFRGSLLSVAIQFFLPTMFAVFLIWAGWLYISRNLILRPYFQSLVDLQKQRALADLATQVAHDIRSPLSALTMVLPALNDVPADVKQLLKSAIERINDIANGLLREGKSLVPQLGNSDHGQEKITPGANEPIMLLSFIDELLSEKRLQHSQNSRVQLASDLSQGYGKFVRIHSGSLMRAISNLVNNSVEAIEGTGTICVALSAEKNLICISVSDDGIGMDQDLLAKVGTRGFSYGKDSSLDSGSGLGLYHAQSLMQEIGGSLTVRSSRGVGTVVTLKIPEAQAPEWFLAGIMLDPTKTVVVVDDDPSVHEAWRRRFSETRSQNFKVNLRTFSDPDTFEQWATTINSSPLLCLIDFDLLDPDQTGLDMIEKLNIPSISILATSRYEDECIKTRSAKLGIKILPKGLIKYVPINILQNEASLHI